MQMKFQISTLAALSKISVLCFVSFLSFLCTSAKSAESDIKQTKTNTFKRSRPFSLIAQPSETGKEGDYAFDFGIADIMDSAQQDRDSWDEDALKLVLPGLKHDFVLQNQTDASITISSITWDCFCIQARVFRDGEVQRTPYKVGPGEKVTVRVAFNYYSVAAGMASSAAVLYGEDLKVPLATLAMKGVVNSGVNFSLDAGAFGDLISGQGASRNFTLTFDRRAPSRIPPVPLRVISTNPYVKVVTDPPEQSKSGVKVEGDQILFTRWRNSEVPEDLTLNFRAELAANAPLGPLSGEIRLIVVGMPIFALVHNTVAPIRGDVVGHMRATPVRILVLQQSPTGKLRRSTQIIFKAPLRKSDLRVETDNPLLLAQLIPVPQIVEEKHDTEKKSGQSQLTQSQLARVDEPIGEDEEVMLLEVSANSTLGAGEIKGKVIVTNTVNQERLELSVYGKVAQENLKAP